MRKIFVFTSSRADYGHLFEIVKGLIESKQVIVKLLVGGTHLSEDFGSTIDQIMSDGFNVDYQINFTCSGDSSLDISIANATALEIAAKIFSLDRPDLLVLLGDRLEILALAQAAFIAGIPIAHIHGGEITEGAVDDSVRHAVTKLSNLHFAATDEYRKRILQLGEAERTVFNFGAPGIDSLKKTKTLTLNEIERELKFKLGKIYFLVTFHPTTLEIDMEHNLLVNFLKVFEEVENAKMLITYPNNDERSSEFIKTIRNAQQKNPDRICIFKSLGREYYINAMRNARAIVGNSSSGIIEAPSIGIPTINIGSRQRGRIRAKSILDCDGSKESIRKAIRMVFNENFRNLCQTCGNPYGDGASAPRIVEVLSNYPLTNITRKRFHDCRVVD